MVGLWGPDLADYSLTGQHGDDAEDVTEDLDHLHQRIDGLNDDLNGVMDSVGFLLMEDEQSFWPDD